MSPEALPRAQIETLRPVVNYLVSEEVEVIALPQSDCFLETKVGPTSLVGSLNVRIEHNNVGIGNFSKPGEYFLQARWVSSLGVPSSDWSVPLRFQVHPSDVDLAETRIRDHQLSLAIERHSNGSSTLADLLSMPPNCPAEGELSWFPTFVFEGCTPLYNEQELYYRDPLTYLRVCLVDLLNRGAVFRTWNDPELGAPISDGLEIILQFDVDGGPRSTKSVVDLMVSLGVRANYMVHRRGHYWYPYQSADGGTGWLDTLADSNSLVGYHNNALSQVLGPIHTQATAEDLDAAEEVFRKDVADLRELVEIQAFTHHGGNVVNSQMRVPHIVGLSGVDRATAPNLWRNITSMFSDGGFLSRPRCLSDHIRLLPLGRHFLRLHPFKYGNYGPHGDLVDRRKFPEQRLGECFSSEKRSDVALASHEQEWLRQRFARFGHLRVNHTKHARLISDKFVDDLADSEIENLRSARAQRFRDEYPWPGGDPRVFWWRMIRSNTKTDGRYLNVGALPPSDKSQGLGFLPHGATMVELDVDGNRAPDITGDITSVAHRLTDTFDGVFLFGLPYFQDPYGAVSASKIVLKSGGIGLFGFPATTHKTRGSLWNPNGRPKWERETDLLRYPSWTSSLWSFDNPKDSGLFNSWSHCDVEFHSHYWFVVAHP